MTLMLPLCSYMYAKISYDYINAKIETNVLHTAIVQTSPNCSQWGGREQTSPLTKKERKQISEKGRGKEKKVRRGKRGINAILINIIINNDSVNFV